MSKEYSRLSQSDGDFESSSNYMVKPNSRDDRRKRSCCLSIFIGFAVVVMICGGVAIIVGIFFTPQVNNLIDKYLKLDNGVIQTNITLNNLQPTNITDNIVTTSIPPPIKAESTTLPPIPALKITKTSNETSDEIISTESSEDLDIGSFEFEGKNFTAKTNATISHGILYHITGNDQILNEAEEKIVTWIDKTEKTVEDVIGIRRPELVVPLLMLACFVFSLLLVSCCCYILMKRREIKRRRLLGRIITDLQTGDSKTVLLDQDVED